MQHKGQRIKRQTVFSTQLLHKWYTKKQHSVESFVVSEEINCKSVFQKIYIWSSSMIRVSLARNNIADQVRELINNMIWRYIYEFLYLQPATTLRAAIMWPWVGHPCFRGYYVLTSLIGSGDNEQLYCCSKEQKCLIDDWLSQHGYSIYLPQNQ